MEKFLVINAGSSSLKFSVYDMPAKRELANGYIEKIGNEDCFWTVKSELGEGEKFENSRYLKNHDEAVAVMMEELMKHDVIQSMDEICGVGHRVLHGGEFYSESVLIDDEVLSNIEALTPLGPLHHPGEIAGIRAMEAMLPGVLQVAVFDTAFHQSMPKENYMYPVPYDWYKKYGVRKYGFHGTSHNYITDQMKDYLGKDDVNLIICHIGSGASITAVKDGKCYDTTMGLTPLDGLMMGTRSGTIDPSVIEYVSKESGMSVEEITSILNKNSGLLGIAGKNDFRDVEQMMLDGNEEAILAMDMFQRSIVRYLGQYYFELNGDVDAIVFTAGIGENAIQLRKDIVEDISIPLGVALDEEANRNIAKFKDVHSGIITSCDSTIPIYVLPTNEELMILNDTYRICNDIKKDDSIQYVKRDLN